MAAFGYLAFCEDNSNDTTDEVNWAALGRLSAREPRAPLNGRRQSRAVGSSAASTMSGPILSTADDRFYRRHDMAIAIADASPIRSRRKHHDADEISVFSSGPRRTQNRPKSNTLTSSRNSPPNDATRLSPSYKQHSRRPSNTDGAAVSSLAASVVGTTNAIFTAQLGHARRPREDSFSSMSSNSSCNTNSSTSANSAIPPIPRKATARGRRG